LQEKLNNRSSKATLKGVQKEKEKMRNERKRKGFYRRSSAKLSLQAGKTTHWSKQTLKSADLHVKQTPSLA